VNFLGLILFMVAMVILGVSCFWVPEKMQVLAIKWVTLGPTAKWHTLNYSSDQGSTCTTFVPLACWRSQVRFSCCGC
jgi:hypothetical protein